MRNTPIRRVLAAGVSAAIAAAGLAALAPAAQAAQINLDFTCSASILSDQQFKLDADFKAPTYVLPGHEIKVSFAGDVIVPDSTRGAAYAFLGGRALEGGATVNGTFGSQEVSLEATLPRTEIPAEAGSFAVPVSGGATFEAAELGAYDLKVSGFTAPLTMTKADGTTTPVEVTCKADAPDTVVTTVNVVDEIPQQATATTAKVKVVKKTAKATVKVVNADKSAAKGKVKLTLKKGKKVVAKKTVTLKKGQKVVTFKKLAKGKYSLLAQYQGDAASKKSKKKVTFRVR